MSLVTSICRSLLQKKMVLRFAFFTAGALALILIFQNCAGFQSTPLGSSEKSSLFSQVTLAVPEPNRRKATALSLNQAPLPKSTHVIFPRGSYQPYEVYSPSLLGSIMAMGGWLHQADIGSDKLYVSRFTGSDWGELSPISWTDPGATAGLIAGYHANDPSLIQSGNTIYMFYTLLKNDYANETDMTRFNWVGYSSSLDNGETWTDRGVLIGQNNGLDNTGAWSPSAVIVGSEIWLYYHTGSGECPNLQCQGPGLAPRVLRTRLDLATLKVLKTEAATDFGGRFLQYTNVDVQKAFDHYYLVANTADLKSIALYLSKDGLTFFPYDGSQGILVSAGPHFLVTPTQQTLKVDELNLIFGFATKKDLTDISLNVWNMPVSIDANALNLAAEREQQQLQIRAAEAQVKAAQEAVRRALEAQVPTPQTPSTPAPAPTPQAPTPQAPSPAQQQQEAAAAQARLKEAQEAQARAEAMAQAARQAQMAAQAQQAAAQAEFQARAAAQAEAQYQAGKAFVDAFASLQTAKSNGAVGGQLQPYTDTCVAAQNNARNWGVSVDSWSCH